MRLIVVSLMLLVTILAPPVASAQPGAQAAGRIRFVAGDQATHGAPVSLSCPIDAPDGRVVVVDPSTGARLPATLRNGELVFLTGEVAPGSSLELEVAVEPDSAPKAVQIRKEPESNALDVAIHGVHLTTFHYGPDQKKPYLWPVVAEGGVHITRDWPMGDKAETDDHVHHKSLWTAYGDVNGVDCWAEGEGSGVQRVRDVQWGDGDAYGWISAELTWTGADGRPAIDESREYRFYATGPEARLVDVRVTFRAAHGEALFGDTKEGGLVAVRMNDALTEEHGAVITHADGSTGEARCWGKPSPWCDYSGAIGDKGVRGLAVFDHPDNLRHPSAWHVRGYGLMGANCFGLSHFTDGAQNGDYTLPADESVTFRYRVYVHSGDAAAAQVAERYADYAGAHTAAWEDASGE